MQTFSELQAHQRLRELAARPSIRPYLLGIVGAPGAGKSTFAEGLGVPVLAMDGFHFANEHLDRRGLRDRKGAPETFDVGGFASALARLRAGEDVLVPRFDRTIDEAIASAIPLSARSPIVVVEGNYLLNVGEDWRSIRPLLDEAWFLDIDDDLRRHRLIERHRRFGRSTEGAVEWADTVDQPNATLILSTRHRADAAVTLS